MGEEVRDPQRIIPRAILAAMAVSALLYAAVGFTAIGAYGSVALEEAARRDAAPLETVLRSLDHPLAARIVAIGAITAMAGVLLNLILGLSRVVLAMARRGDLPRRLAAIDRRSDTPAAAVIATGLVVLALVLTGDIRLTWSFSAFTVLLYYALTNLSALRLAPVDRLYPRIFARVGLAACVLLAFWVEPAVWLVGLGILALGLIGRRLLRRTEPV